MLLTISIPTFNRHRRLNQTIMQLDRLGYLSSSQVVIKVFDNGDTPKDVIKSYQASGIIYNCNERNIGFSGNFKRYLTEFESEYVWIVSDDDLCISFDTLISVIRREGKSLSGRLA
jgi:glycosyltransferase involved in cell wall biosynthesis